MSTSNSSGLLLPFLSLPFMSLPIFIHNVNYSVLSTCPSSGLGFVSMSCCSHFRLQSWLPEVQSAKRWSASDEIVGEEVCHLALLRIHDGWIVGGTSVLFQQKEPTEVYSSQNVNLFYQSPHRCHKWLSLWGTACWKERAVIQCYCLVCFHQSNFPLQ